MKNDYESDMNNEEISYSNFHKKYKNNSFVNIICIILLLIALVFFIKSWFSKSVSYTKLSTQNINILTQKKRSEFINSVANVNEESFSIKNLYNILSSDCKQKYNTLSNFENYLNDNIISKLEKGKDFIKITYNSQEKKKGKKYISYTAYIYPISNFSAITNNDTSKAKFSYNITLIDSGINNYMIEI